MIDAESQNAEWDAGCVDAIISKLCPKGYAGQRSKDAHSSDGECEMPDAGIGTGGGVNHAKVYVRGRLLSEETTAGPKAVCADQEPARSDKQKGTRSTRKEAACSRRSSRTSMPRWRACSTASASRRCAWPAAAAAGRCRITCRPTTKRARSSGATSTPGGRSRIGVSRPSSSRRAAAA